MLVDYRELLEIALEEGYTKERLDAALAEAEEFARNRDGREFWSSGRQYSNYAEITGLDGNGGFPLSVVVSAGTSEPGSIATDWHFPL